MFGGVSDSPVLLSSHQYRQNERRKEEEEEEKTLSLLENDTTTTSKEVTSPQDRVSIENPSCKTAVSNDISTPTNAKKSIHIKNISPLPPPNKPRAPQEERKKK